MTNKSTVEPRVKAEGPAVKEFRRIFHKTRFTDDIRYQPELIAAVLEEIKLLCTLETAAPAGGDGGVVGSDLIDAAIEVLTPFAEVADDFDIEGRVLADEDGIYANYAGDFRRARQLMDRLAALRQQNAPENPAKGGE